MLEQHETVVENELVALRLWNEEFVEQRAEVLRLFDGLTNDVDERVEKDLLGRAALDQVVQIGKEMRGQPEVLLMVEFDHEPEKELAGHAVVGHVLHELGLWKVELQG